MTMNTTARWKLVPVEPTPEMVREARHSIDCPASGSDHPADIYRAMLSAAPAPAAPQDERASLNDLLLDVGALLSPLVEAGHAIAIGEARRVLKRVRTARAALPAQAVAPARYTDADMLKAHAQGFKHGARHAQLAVATVGDEPVMEIMADMEMNSTGGMHVVRMLKPVPAGSLLYTRPAPAQAATAGGHEIWACWVDGADPDKTWPMFVGYEPMAYPQRKRVAFVSAPAQDVAPRDVTSILLHVEPGSDGMGHEVYAKSVEDVEAHLSALGSEMEEWQLGIRRLGAQDVAPTDARNAWHAAVSELLGHLSDVLTDDAWSLIDTKLWNAVSALTGAAPQAGVQAAPITLQDCLNEFDFLEGLVNQHTYIEIARKAFEIAARATQPAAQPADAQTPDVAKMREALEFYAHGGHFMLADESAWDTVSGEPPNLWCDDAGTATIEDGSIAKAALAAAPAATQEVPTEQHSYVVFTRPGMVPERKGPYPTPALIEAALRELQAAHPDATSMVITLSEHQWPQSGVEWIDMHGDQRKGRLIAAPQPAARYDMYAEGAAFQAWWNAHQAHPAHTLITENAAHAAWQERAKRAAAHSPPSGGSGQLAGGQQDARYRLLDEGDTIQADDEFVGDDGTSWEHPTALFVGMRYINWLKTGRRRIGARAQQDGGAQ